MRKLLQYFWHSWGSHWICKQGRRRLCWCSFKQCWCWRWMNSCLCVLTTPCYCRRTHWLLDEDCLSRSWLPEVVDSATVVGFTSVLVVLFPAWLLTFSVEVGCPEIVDSSGIVGLSLALRVSFLKYIVTNSCFRMGSIETSWLWKYSSCFLLMFLR